MNPIGWTAALALALQGAAPAGTPLQPTGKWQVAFEDDLCAMSRDFGAGPTALTLAFRPFPMNSQMEAVLILPNKRGAQRKGKAKVTLLPSNESVDAAFDAFDTSQKVRAVHIDLDRSVFERLGGATGLRIAADKDLFDLALPSASGALKVLAQCETSLLQEWGVDPALRDKERAAAIGNPASFFGANDFPPAAVGAGAGGRVLALLSISAEGRVTACRVVKSSRVAVLDSKTCEIATRRMRYKPAIGPDGAPVATYTLLPVRWQLPS